MEAGPAGVGEVAGQVFLLGIGHGMDQDVEAVFLGMPTGENALDLVVVPDIATFHESGADRVGERSNAPLDQRRHRTEANPGALIVQPLRYPPGDRMVVGDAENQGLLAVEQTHMGDPP